MTEKTKVAIVGYGNLGRGAQTAIARTNDLQLVAVFSRRDPAQVSLVDDTVPVYPLDRIDEFADQIDVVILCGGSKNDLPVQGPDLAARFNTVDSFDTHARIPEYFQEVDEAARKAGTTALISVGWDPGLFSINRMLGEAILPDGQTDTFWGKGLSQGHSDAVRRVSGVKAGVQYTLPSESAMERVRRGEQPELTTRERHVRECYVVLEDGADAQEVRQAIVTMPNYFADYDTTVHFIDQATLDRDHADMPHGGFVIRGGRTGNNSSQIMEFSLKLQSNPEFTASVLVAYARAVHRMSRLGQQGAHTVYDVAPGLLSPRSAAELRRDLL